MRSVLVVARPDEPIGDLCDRLQEERVHCAPVVGDDGELVGIVSTEDLLYGGAFGSPSDERPDAPPRPATVREIMTSPVITIGEDATLREICETMWSYRIHHLPIDRDGILVGLVSTMDLCRLVAEGTLDV